VFGGLTDYHMAGQKISEGNFQEAGSELERVATGIDPGGLDVTKQVHDSLAERFQRLSELMKPFEGGEEFPAAGQFVSVANAAAQAAESEDDKALAAQLTALGQLMGEHADALSQVMVDVYSESRPFEIIEYKRTSSKTDTETEAFAGSREETTTTFPVAQTMQNATPIVEGETRKATLDLFEDLTHGGKFRVAVFCLDSGQYIGMARPDLYIRTPDRSFESGYYKAVIGIWLMVLLVVALSVTASTFVKGPVATLLTATLIIVGLFFHSFLEELVTKLPGKGFGALESIVRIVEHKNPTTPLDTGRPTQVMEFTDNLINRGLWTVYKVVPNFNVFSLTPYVANGFDVPFDAGLLPALAMTLAYLFPCLFIGYFSLRLRELEAK
jgi:hypothetical protein